MKIRAERGPLADALTWVAQAISKNPPSPVLAGIRLAAAAGGTLTASAFDYDVAHTSRVDVDVASEGECLVSGRFLRAIVGAMNGREVELTLDGGSMAIASGRATYRTQAMRLDDYPTLPESPPAVGTVAAEELLAGLAAVRHPIDDGSVHDQVRGLRIEASNELVLVGMDRSRLARAVIAWKWEADLAVTVHSGAFEAAAKGLAGTVTIRHQDGVVGLSDASRAVTLRTYADDFTPLWSKLLERPDGVATAKLESADLRSALKRVRELNVAAESAVVVTIGDGEFRLSGLSDGVGEGDDVLEAETEGEASRGFMPRYLADALAANPGGPLLIHAGTAHQPKLWLIEPLDHPHLTFAVMTKALPGGAR